MLYALNFIRVICQTWLVPELMADSAHGVT